MGNLSKPDYRAVDPQLAKEIAYLRQMEGMLQTMQQQDRAARASIYPK